MSEGALLSRPLFTGNGIFFWLLRCLVRVHYSFFLMAVLLGLRNRSVLDLAVWVVVVFVGVLLHELGHAFAVRFFGERPQIELHTMGGHTTWTPRAPFGWGQRVCISLAGPAIGFAAGGLLAVAGGLVPDTAPHALRLARSDFLWVTLGWGVFNLFPILPLDGGQTMQQVLERVTGRGRGKRLAHQVSIGTALAGLAASLLLSETWMAFLFGTFAFDNYQQLRGFPGVALPR